MKRTPLVRKSRLATVTPIRRGSPLVRGVNRLPPMSDKRRAANVVRSVVVAAIRAVAPRCSMCHRLPYPDELFDAHELLSRARGGSITDPRNIVLLCRHDHDYITTHPAWAEANGWALNSWADVCPICSGTIGATKGCPSCDQHNGVIL